MAHRLTLRTGDGQQHDTVGPLVLGRAPNRAGFTPVTLTHEVDFTSKNHLLVTPSDQVVELVDLGSTNGTIVTIGSSVVELIPDERTHVTLPCTLRCGDSVVELVRPS